MDQGPPEITHAEPVGVVAGGRAEPTDDGWGDVVADILLDDRFAEDSTAGLDEFSHIEVTFQFHLVSPQDVHLGARHPRDREDWPLVGIFAQRGRVRPNRLGHTICELLEVRGTRIRVRGLDAVDGSPVLDIKPTMEEFLPRSPIRQPDWSRELMDGYW